MFSKIIDDVKAGNYEVAKNALLPLLKSDNAKTVATANYLLGYINTCYDYKDRNVKQARRYLLHNINSEYPQSHAYHLYAGVEEDANVAMNYLQKGADLFPNEISIFEKMLDISFDKNSVIALICKQAFTEKSILCKVIKYLISSRRWDDIGYYAEIIEKQNVLEQYEVGYLCLIKAYSYAFSTTPDYLKSEENFRVAINLDIDNDYHYSHYLGLVYALIKQGETEKALGIFDQIPVNNSICDFDDCPYPLDIGISFEDIYKIIFDLFKATFANDSKRKIKASALYSLYIYYPSQTFEFYRFKKSDASNLERFLKSEKNYTVACALYNMRCYFKQYVEAYNIAWMLINRYENPEDHSMSFSDIADNAFENIMLQIADLTVKKLKEGEYDDEDFLPYCFDSLIEKLHDGKKYSYVRNIADQLSDGTIAQTESLFECAYAYGKENLSRSISLYELLLKKKPNNSAALNNLGVQYEHRGNLPKALEYFEQSLSFNPTDDICSNNLNRVREALNQQLRDEFQEVSDAISLDSLEAIGYTQDLCKKIMSISDTEMRDIIVRDLRECAIAIVAKQTKSATIMCGSIVEALLMQKISDKQIKKYDISEISKHKDAPNYSVKDMALNELLYVADKEKILDKNNYHLGHYIRDYRNVVHPAKEKRTKGITDENVSTMWSVLKRIINDIY